MLQKFPDRTAELEIILQQKDGFSDRHYIYFLIVILYSIQIELGFDLFSLLRCQINYLSC